MVHLQITAVLFAFAVAKAQLVVVEAGINGKRGPTLTDGFYFCPIEFSAKGFSVMCKIGNTKYATFSVNGAQKRRESFEPFMINGDWEGDVYDWKDYPKGDANIECRGSNGLLLSANGSFSCSKETKVRGSHRSRELKTQKKVLKGGVLKPNNESTMSYTKTRKQDSANSGSDNSMDYDKSWQADHSRNPSEDRAERMQQRKKKIADTLQYAKESSAENRPTALTNEVNPQYCVTKRGTEYSEDLADGWSRSGTAVVYKKDENSTISDTQNTAVLRYDFSVPVRSHYAFTLDMTTKHPVDHNDVWVKCPFGITLRREKGGKVHVRNAGSGFLKAYHNDNGRAKATFSKDFDPHSFSSTTPLKPGKIYACMIGGRSSKVVINGLILFPCDGDTCQAYSEHWKQFISVCHV